jgi:hypothetical protein
MSLGIIIERTVGDISLEEWKRMVAQHSDLRIRQEPYFARNPASGEKIEIAVGSADAEFNWDGQWIPLLRFDRGRLVTEYSSEYVDPANAERIKIVQLARELDAVIMTDLSDEALHW